ncbi:hypothetical protein M8J75_015355 [Diaphorina citri]|nr:hypothetical protein M8J75_015355 [Diaphorina citri]
MRIRFATIKTTEPISRRRKGLQELSRLIIIIHCFDLSDFKTILPAAKPGKVWEKRRYLQSDSRCSPYRF